MKTNPDIQLSLSHLGYLPGSPKILTLAAREPLKLSHKIPFYLRQNCLRIPRLRKPSSSPYGLFSERFPCPYNLLEGKLLPKAGTFYYQGTLKRMESRWGTFWQADFSDFQQSGSYQIETDFQVSTPFMIAEDLYDRLILGYMTFLRAQRCGYKVYGVHPACHLDDGVLDTDGSSWPVTGGWHDAGDFRKWLSLTLHHLETLVTIWERQKRQRSNQEGFDEKIIGDEIAWGNRFFHGMITSEGQVYEDVAGGGVPAGSAFTYQQHWWFENHPGCYGDASDNRWTDNILNSGDERKVRTCYNPLVQFAFVSTQARVSQVLPPHPAAKCLSLAEKAWQYGMQQGHDKRTLFLTTQLRAALELLTAGSKITNWTEVEEPIQELLSRQEVRGKGLSGYFLEKNGSDAYRSIAYSADPTLALVRFCELKHRMPKALVKRVKQCRDAVERFIEEYLLADARSNPFGITPYGVYMNPPYSDQQLFRPAGKERWVRTFIHPFNSQGIAHGTGSVLMSHAHLLARAGFLFGKRKWQNAAERLLHWSLGHNPTNRSLFTGIGYRQPIGYSFRVTQLPEAMLSGFIGRPDDSPYLEESTAIEWNTLEYWSVPFYQTAMAVCFL